jgi:hypothetical protein
MGTRLYPGGGGVVEMEPLRHEQAVGATVRAMEDPLVKAICEAGFLYDDVRVKVDIPERLESGKWNLIERIPLEGGNG